MYLLLTTVISYGTLISSPGRTCLRSIMFSIMPPVTVSARGTFSPSLAANSGSTLRWVGKI